MKQEDEITKLADEIRAYLEENGHYEVGDNYIIQLFAETLVAYRNIHEKWQKSGYRTHIVSRGSLKKDPVADQVAVLRKDLLSISDRLLLNPKSINFDNKQEDLGDLANFITQTEKQNGL